MCRGPYAPRHQPVATNLGPPTVGHQPGATNLGPPTGGLVPSNTRAEPVPWPWGAVRRQTPRLAAVQIVGRLIDRKRVEARCTVAGRRRGQKRRQPAHWTRSHQTRENGLTRLPSSRRPTTRTKRAERPREDLARLAKLATPTPPPVRFFQHRATWPHTRRMFRSIPLPLFVHACGGRAAPDRKIGRQPTP